MKNTTHLEIPYCELCESREESIFANLPTELLKNISPNKGCNFYKKGQIIFYEGNRPAGLYCIHDGKVKIVKLGEDGREQIVRLATSSDVLGYRSLVCNELYNASAETLEDTCVCFIPKQLFLDMMLGDTTFSLIIIKLLSADLKEAEEKITSLAQKHVKQRIAGALLLLKEKYGLEDDQSTLQISLTREDLANLVGTATESVIRLLQELKSENVISLKKRKIKIQDEEALIKAAKLYD